MSSKVTVYVSSYNYAEFLIECLDSVISQPYENMEVLIHDDASTDNSLEIIHDYMNKDKRITKLFVESENKGPNSGINWAFSEATGEYFATLCTDDYFAPNFWETVLPYFDSPDIGFVRVALMNFGPYIASPSYMILLPLNNPLDIFEGNRVYVSSPIRMTMQKQIGLYDEKTILSDWDYWIRCIMGGWKWRDCKEAMFYRRTHYKSISVQGGHLFGRGGKDWDYIAEKWQPTLKKYNYRLSTVWRETPIVKP